MRHRFMGIILCTCAAGSVAAQQPTGIYFGVAGLLGEIETDDQDLHTPGFAAKLGYEFNRHLGLEAHVGSTASDEDGSIEGQLDYFAGAYARGQWSWQAIDVYGLLGIGHGEADFDVGPVSRTETETDVSYGLGIELFGTPRTALYAEGVRYLNQDELRADFLSLGISHRF